MKNKYLLVVSLLVLVLAACAPATGAANVGANTLSVTGQSEVALTPDIAYVTVGVRTETDDVSLSVSRNAAAVDEVLAALESAGVAAEDMRTANFNVYSYDQYDFEGSPSGKTYAVENTVYVTVRNLPQMGDLLDEVVNAGANSIWGIQFDASDKTAAIAEARQLAVENAKQQAEQLAADAGVTLGDISSVSFSQGGFAPYPAYGMGGGAAYDTSSTQIVPGQISVAGTVLLVYDIR